MPISPNQGSTGGGTLVTITGAGLAGTTAVHFGSKSAAFTQVSPTQVNATSPSGTGTVNVTVTTPGGTSNPISFYYVNPPFKSSLNPTSGVVAGGNTVTLNGTGLSSASSVSFGANAATPTVVNDGALTITVPAATAAGTVDVTVTTAGGTNDGLTYTYVAAPTVASLSPTSGPTSGGTTVTITGTGLTTTQSVTFGGATASFGVINDTTVTAVTPPGAAGAVDVTVTTTGGSATLAGGYTYTAGPGI
ncbi:MAG: IPT/TIG domain-containing protein [Streptomycetaceae bacterium]|nr:IPT/TIG domain-containing protein [Streptomycetaceae bacterium]